MGQKRRKLQYPKSRIFDNPAVIDFSRKMEVKVMAPNHVGDPLGSILGPMRSHWVQKMSQNVENYHAPNFEFSTTPRSSIFPKKGTYGYGAKSSLGTPRVHLGAKGVPLGPKKWVKTVKNDHASKLEFLTTPRSSILCKKWKLHLWRQIKVGTP